VSDPPGTVDQLLTVAQAAVESGFSQITIRRHIAKGALPVVKWGPFGRIRIRRADFQRYLVTPVVSSSVSDSHA
jgi:excisionase family DNA binding protein